MRLSSSSLFIGSNLRAMPWTTKSRDWAWREVILEPDRPLSAIARDAGVSPKALRDLIAEREKETGISAPPRRRGRPDRRITAWDLITAINHSVLYFDDEDIDRQLGWRESLREALRGKRAGKADSLGTDAESVVASLATPAGLAFVLAITGHPQLRRESDHISFAIDHPLPPIVLKDLAQQLARSGAVGQKFENTKDRIRISTKVRPAPWAPSGYGKVTPLEIGAAALWLRKHPAPSDEEKAKEGRYLVGALRRELRRLEAIDPGLHGQARKWLKYRRPRS